MNRFIGKAPTWAMPKNRFVERVQQYAGDPGLPYSWSSPRKPLTVSITDLLGIPRDTYLDVYSPGSKR